MVLVDGDAHRPYTKTLGELVDEMTLYLINNNEAIKKRMELYYSTHQKHIESLNNLQSELESKIKNLAKRKPMSERKIGNGNSI